MPPNNNRRPNNHEPHNTHMPPNNNRRPNNHEPHNTSGRERILRVGRRVYLVVLAAALAGLATAKRDDVAVLLTGAKLPLLAIALMASFGLIWLNAWFWALSLRMLEQPLPIGETALATARALPARYVPTGAGFAIGRAVLLRTAGVSSGPLAATAVLDMTISVPVALVGGTALLSASGTLPGGAVPAWIAAGLLAAVSPLASRILAWIVARRGISLSITRHGLLRLTAVSCIYWIWNSATFTLYLKVFPAADGFGGLETAGAFMVAWAVGFLAVFAPQGIGVVETGMVVLLTAGGGEWGSGSESDAIGLAVVFSGYRLVQMIRDATAVVAGEIIATLRVRRGSERTG